MSTSKSAIAQGLKHGVKYGAVVTSGFCAAAGYSLWSASKNWAWSWYQSRESSKKLLERVGRDMNVSLTAEEEYLISSIVKPSEAVTTFKDVGGLDTIIERLEESVIEPLTNLSPSPNQSSLLSAPTGVLFYGPPGTGKTTLARALAHESKACFMNIQISEISSKWHGESEKFVSAIFSLAKKVEPTLVFIDEIDSLLSTRRDQDQQFLHAIKAEFMSKWDGLSSIDQAGKRARIVIIGATNRRDNIDPACLSRMPSQFLVPLPDHQQRESLLRIFLRGITIDDEQLDLNALALSMDSLSGRDIQNECREAALIPQREAKKEKKSAGMNDQEKSNLRGDVVRGLAMQDFIEAREMAGGQHKRQGHPSSQEFPSDGGRETTHR